MTHRRGLYLGAGLTGLAGMTAAIAFAACGGEPPPPAQPPPVVPALSEPNQIAPLPPDDASAPDAAPPVHAASTGPAVTVLARGLHGSSAIDLDHGAVYWIDETEGDLQRIPKRGGVTMVTYGGNGNAFGPGASLAVDDTDVYWTAAVQNGATRASTLSRQDKNGGKPTVVASSPSPLACVVVDDQSMYFVEGIAIMKASKRGGAPTGLAGGQIGANCVAVDDKSVYFSLGGTDKAQFTDGSIAAVPKAGGAPKVLVKAADHAANLVVDGSSVYWVSGNRIMKAPKAGGDASELAKAAGPVGDIALDDAFVYFTVPAAGTDGTVARAPKAGGAATVLASGQAQPAGIAVDWAAVYWTCRGTDAAKYRDGTISKVDKPQ